MARKILLFAVIALMAAVGTAHGTATGAATTVQPVYGGKVWYNSWGTNWYKFTMVTDSTGATAVDTLGRTHHSTITMKTEWVEVPVGIPFVVFVETQDADSTIAWGADGTNPDTVSLALETTFPGGIAVDSVSSVYKSKNVSTLWLYESTSWAAFTTQHYFENVWADTLNDTANVDGGLSPVAGTKQTTPLVNLGLMRFSLCVHEDADTVCDSRIRLNVAIVFQANPIGQRHSFYNPFVNDGPIYSVVDRRYEALNRYERWALVQSKPLLER